MVGFLFCKTSIPAVNRKNIASDTWLLLHMDDLTNIYYEDREAVSCLSDDLSQTFIDGNLCEKWLL